MFFVIAPMSLRNLELTLDDQQLGKKIKKSDHRGAARGYVMYCNCTTDVHTRNSYTSYFTVPWYARSMTPTQ
jgi:hypothetical protein